jgi:hypothetical protein
MFAHLVVCGRQCCFQRRSCKRSLRPTLRYARSWRSNESACGRSGRRSKGQHEKRGGLWGRKPPRRRHDSSCCRNLSPRCQQQMHSNPSQPRSAISVNPQAEAIFWTTELTVLSDKDRSRACVPGCLSEKSAISRRSTRSVTQSRAIRSNKIIRSFAILNKA